MGDEMQRSRRRMAHGPPPRIDRQRQPANACEREGRGDGRPRHRRQGEAEPAEPIADQQRRQMVEPPP